MWKAFFLEEDKRKGRERDSSMRHKIHMFAVNGHDYHIAPSASLNFSGPGLKVGGRHQAISLEAITQWHIPLQANQKSTDLKLFSRWSLGLSKTTPTITLEQHEFRYLPDTFPVMNDGCALMSYELAKAIWAKYNGNGEGELPTVFQGRIAGAKGLWMVDYHNSHPHVSERKYWIEVSDSQLKIKPHPRDRDADAFLRTFEVLQVSGECSEGHLNMQLITILEDRGVAPETLAEALRADTRSYSDSLNIAMDSAMALRLWLQEHMSGGASDSKMLAAFPFQKREQLIRLLDSGFQPRENVKLVNCAANILSTRMNEYCEKLRIRLPCSTVVYCVPDPLGILAEDEVCINFTRPVRNPQTGMNELMLDGLDVLVARNPAHLASDIQRRKAVYKHELRQCKNVIIFPTKGHQALASLLSGGDYDGDKVTVIWDPDIVKDFRNAELPQFPDHRQCGMRQMAQPLSDIFETTATRPLDDGIQAFVQRCFDFNARPNLLGECSTEHEKLVYALSRKGTGNKLAAKGPVTLAALAGYLVDSNKQGWSLDRTSWNSLRREVSGLKKLDEPAYKSGGRPKGDNMPQNIIDYLKFDVADNESEKVLKEFAVFNEKAGSYDITLSQCWQKAREQARKESQCVADTRNSKASVASETHDMGTLKDILDALLSDLRMLRTRCETLLPGGDVDNSRGDPQKSKKYRDAVQTIYEEYQAIEPKFDHWLRRQFEAEKGEHSSYWARLRASCLYFIIFSKRGNPAWVWYVAGPDLCELKARSLGGGNTRLLSASMYKIMKVNSKLTRAILEKKEVMNKMEVNEADDDEVEELDVAGGADF